MKTFSTGDLSRKIGDVTHAASQAPVTITQHNKPRYVMMSVETFQRLDPRRAYSTGNTPPEIADWLVPQLEAFARGEGEYEK
ncbi:MAG: type II toxin-antitoxin system Phd/YefM family antitoxin [Hyphomicrobiales bacterium]|nr:type II toxin-antitoxin system Phd/YefM family antitoxin [Hyphomicrobiales bacterium]